MGEITLRAALRWSAIAGLALLTLDLAGQASSQAPPAAAQPPVAAPPAPAGRQGGRGGAVAVFPAQQRPPGDPALIERGRGLYTTSCSACHGADLRGGRGGPNLLRSPIVLSDQRGELILPIVHGGRVDRGMPALPLTEPDVVAVAEYVHSVTALSERQGRPPATDAPPPNAVVGDPRAGATYFQAACARCHSASGDLQGIGARLSEGKALQNAWVIGRGGGRSPADPSPAERRTAVVTVTLPSGERVTGPLVRIDNFLVTLRQSDGTPRTFRRDGDQPRVDIADPLAAHKGLLATLTDKDMHDVTAYLAGLK